jgi:hypothetical protein
MDYQSKATSTYEKFRNTFIGDRNFYNTVLALVVPIIVQVLH